MTKTNDGGPAFPIAVPELWNEKADGMSLRDYFAGQALVGMSLPIMYVRDNVHEITNKVAYSAYAYADAMLKAREGGDD